MKINRRSANITEGVARAPNRSMYYALGYEEGDFKKPMIGVANGHSTITPCNSGLQRLADAAVDLHGRSPGSVLAERSTQYPRSRNRRPIYLLKQTNMSGESETKRPNECPE